MMLRSFFVTLRDRLVNLRTCERQPSDHASMLSLVKEIGEAPSLEVRCRDMSGGGMRVVSPVPLRPATLVRISVQEKVRCALVRHCTKVGREYEVGLQFTPQPKVAPVTDVARLDLHVAGINCG
jgi:hypothetical protein